MDNNSTYTIPRPAFPVAAWLLGAAVLIGLIGLGAVAFHVFSLVDPWPVALCFALVIEVGAVAEAIAILRKNRIALGGAVVSVLVSGTYNVTRLQSAGLALSWAESAALAIGPLSAVLFLALSLSHELQVYEQALAKWAKDRQAWQDHQAELTARREERKAVKLAEIESASRVQLAQPAQTSVQPAQRYTYEDFRRVQAARNGSGPMDHRQVMERFNVSRRTAYNWLERYQTEPTPSPEPTNN